MNDRQAIAAVQMWKSKRFSTWDIAEILGCHEADVEKVIHRDRTEARALSIAEAALA